MKFDPDKLIQATRLSRIAKATVHCTGRLGFSQGAAKMLGLGEDKSVLLFQGEGRNLFLTVVDGHDERGFFTRSIGAYWYIPTKVYFDQAGIDYEHNIVDFEITEMPERFEGKPVFMLRCRERARGAKGGEEFEKGEEDIAQDTRNPNNKEPECLSHQEASSTT